MSGRSFESLSKSDMWLVDAHTLNESSIGVKARDPLSRRKANRLLTDANRRESTLNSAELACYSQAVALLEERHVERPHEALVSERLS